MAWIFAAAEVFFHSERSGHIQVGWSQAKQGSGNCEVHRVNCNLWPELFLVVFTQKEIRG